jgi:ABC-type transporter Mla MlaB component
LTWSVRESDATITISLCGELDESQAQTLAAELRERLTSVTPGTYAIVFDLDELRRCSVEGRAVLAELQRYLGGVIRRTAYVTNRPLIRGVALWICHSAPDANARAFPTHDAAAAWLSSSEARDVVLMRGASSWIERARSLVFVKEASR